MTTGVVADQPAGAAPPREWWQVWAQRRAAWWAARPVLAARWVKVRAVGLWVALVWVLGLFVFVPEVRFGLRAWLGCVWVVVAWYVLARTKSLTWTGYLRFFTACVVWSFVVGLVSRWLTTVVLDLSVSQDGPSVMIAAITEETLKLVPLAVVALLAPRRAARFAAVDWLLLGLAGGTAFLLVEESLRRLALAIGKAGIGFSSQRLPEEFDQFGWWPVPVAVNDRVQEFAGHGIVTAVVAAWVGLGIAAVRAVRGRDDRVALGVRVGAVLVPVIALLVAVADHAAYNGGDRSGRWLDPQLTHVPWLLRATWSAFGHGNHRPALLVVLLVLALVVDAGRLARLPAAALVVVPRPGWVDACATRVGQWTRTWPEPLRAWAHAVGFAVPGTLWVIARDLRTAVAGFAKGPAQSRRAAAQQGATALAAQRAARELGYETMAHPVDPSRRRTLAAGALLALLAAGLVLAPFDASRMERVYELGFWLAGILGRVDDWWHGQPLGMQIAIGVGIAALIALSGGSLAMAMGISGVLTWGLDKSAGIATFVRDPDQATRDYLATATPTQLALDTLGFVLTFGPGAFGGAVLGRGVRTVADDVVADPAAWLAARRFDLAEDAGVLDLGAFLRREPVPLADGSVKQALDDAEQAVAQARFNALPTSGLRGGHEAGSAYQTRIYGPTEKTVVLADGTLVHPDGFTPQYAAVGDAKHVGSGTSSFYAPEPGSSLERIVIAKVDPKLLNLADAARQVGGPDAVVEYVTNSAAAARFLESRMVELGIRGYVRLVP
ncbi:restriction endonuclease fold toxin-2 domain-containing protein [Cellulomonas sp. S1-8]|uniref:restriction endonuclease fold toxin-2 domain-containing protein n=1 Tax=Cellulomonas sp. S1-8 TaxID=2904790 RepID=UPI0022435350|nr:restriction endonuclease fold toxin-2 domain-containing protein [Cellulomonas sp. S1-8]UZN01640.1 hypothetical protein OKX07_11030 [Cellulomonas sp. S1-8]